VFCQPFIVGEGIVKEQQPTRCRGAFYQTLRQIASQPNSRTRVWRYSDNHTWASLDGVMNLQPSLTLNNAEVNAITPNNRFLNATVSLYKDSIIRLVPLPDSARLETQEIHFDSFQKLLIEQNLNPAAFQLHYVRYYILPVGSQGDLTLRPRIAYGYSEKGSDKLRVELSFVRLRTY
jgi:hypothetical protein